MYRYQLLGTFNGTLLVMVDAFNQETWGYSWDLVMTWPDWFDEIDLSVPWCFSMAPFSFVWEATTRVVIWSKWVKLE